MLDCFCDSHFFISLCFILFNIDVFETDMINGKQVMIVKS